MREHRIFAAMLLVLASCRHGATEPAGAQPVQSQVTRLADDYVAQVVARLPEQAELSAIPLPRHDGLSDNSLAALSEWRALEDRWAERVAAIDARRLFGQRDWVTLGFLREAVESSRQLRVCRAELWQTVSQMCGWQAVMAALAEAQPVGSETARQEALARYGKLSRFLDTEVA